MERARVLSPVFTTPPDPPRHNQFLHLRKNHHTPTHWEFDHGILCTHLAGCRWGGKGTGRAFEKTNTTSFFLFIIHSRFISFCFPHIFTLALHCSQAASISLFHSSTQLPHSLTTSSYNIAESILLISRFIRLTYPTAALCETASIPTSIHLSGRVSVFVDRVTWLNRPISLGLHRPHTLTPGDITHKGHVTKSSLQEILPRRFPTTDTQNISRNDQPQRHYDRYSYDPCGHQQQRYWCPASRPLPKPCRTRCRSA